MVQRVQRSCRRMAMKLNCIAAQMLPTEAMFRALLQDRVVLQFTTRLEARHGPHLEAPLAPRRHLQVVLLLVAAVVMVRKSPPLSQVMRTMETPPPPHLQLLVSVETPHTCHRFRWTSCLMPHRLHRHKESRRVR
jgi:hypothetical protein